MSNAVVQDDGDETRFCSTCVFGKVCLPHQVSKEGLHELHCLVQHLGPLRPGEHLFRSGDPFNALYAVRSGTIKTCLYDRAGREQVLGFHLPGEMVGLSAIHPARYPCDAVALDAAEVCRFSFGALATLAMRLPAVQSELFRLLSKDISNAALFAGDYPAAERLAVFLLNFDKRAVANGKLSLAMSRTDIANYLRLTPETVSRVLRRFRDDGLVKARGRTLEILRPQELKALAWDILQR